MPRAIDSGERLCDELRAQVDLHVGDATVTKIPELALDVTEAEVHFPGQVNVSTAVEETRKLWGGSVDGQTGQLRQSIHAWLVRTPTRVILVDTATGNGKNRPNLPILNHLNEPFLDRLKAAGVRPEEVDLVLHTHLHVDHVGWNTRKIDGRWVPTFPNARYIFSGRERAYLAALSAADGSDAAIRTAAKLGPMPQPPLLGIYEGVYEDSVLPVIEAGLAREIVVDGTEVAEGVSFLPSPGHSIDHACIRFASRGEQALFWGDVMHHPLQFVRPDWNSQFCEFPDAARESRRWAMNYAAETNALVFTTHFAESSVGRVSREGGRLAWHFA
ncbi:MBL fold metallo-hydrolase [Singulisphaera acidiphila]|uniref:Zn-dependent hydrolase, glyoxylase n=1 Tax=Singulisphaera acidiphila (strain ATCC BAA-1392 / DSM 18658 / VKM B-2454 / MOB10) TaxID=886293 RepID=L0D816_SINAD|nr:MBL fold metallo-hydrolase [Singulisphaera acidiphila]AGA25010.1 Zn-dependent hydrolase, glyoxylase [Singulisphaera acidiphila DSM 18658]